MARNERHKAYAEMMDSLTNRWRLLGAVIMTAGLALIVWSGGSGYAILIWIATFVIVAVLYARAKRNASIDFVRKHPYNDSDSL